MLGDDVSEEIQIDDPVNNQQNLCLAEISR